MSLSQKSLFKRIFRQKKFYVVMIWLMFTSAFAIWWMVLGFSYVKMLAELLPDQTGHWESQRRMLLWEGVAWITLLVFGGISLVYFMTREMIHFEHLKTFFASFNHDVKTSLASLRLQAESLKEDMIQGDSNPQILDRLISDTMRLQVQLENSLYLGAGESSKVLIEPLQFSKLVESAKMRWPQIQITFNRDAKVEGDQRAMVTALNNLIQNSLVHGQATEFNFNLKNLEASQIEIGFFDNGKGFSGSRESLGQLFYRPTSKSGSGLGLYICHDLLKKMNGRLLLNTSSSGFSGAFVLKGRVI